MFFGQLPSLAWNYIMFHDWKTKSRLRYACRKLLSECHSLFHEIPSRNSRDITKQSLTPRTKKIIYSTWCSQAVTHLSTNHARRCLTSVIGREPVFSTWYGRRHWMVSLKLYIQIAESRHKDKHFRACNTFEMNSPLITDVHYALKHHDKLHRRFKEGKTFDIIHQPTARLRRSSWDVSQVSSWISLKRWDIRRFLD